MYMQIMNKSFISILQKIIIVSWCRYKYVFIKYLQIDLLVSLEMAFKLGFEYSKSLNPHCTHFLKYTLELKPMDKFEFDVFQVV